MIDLYTFVFILAAYVYAQEDENIDDIVDVEGEESSIITDEETEEDTSNASVDADTTILFTKPIHKKLSTLGTFIDFFLLLRLKYTIFFYNTKIHFKFENRIASWKYNRISCWIY